MEIESIRHIIDGTRPMRDPNRTDQYPCAAQLIALKADPYLEIILDHNRRLNNAIDRAIEEFALETELTDMEIIDNTTLTISKTGEKTFSYAGTKFLTVWNWRRMIKHWEEEGWKL